jgi:pantothenate kinase
MLGIAGAPGAGKSTLATELVEALGAETALIPMDGFHLAEAELHRIGRREFKGAIDTFDVGGFVALLRRLRAADEPVVYAPLFRREIGEAIAGWIPVVQSVPLVVVEGNYLLVDQGRWSAIRGLLDEVWFVELDEAIRLERLVQRHMSFGRDRTAAELWVRESDQRNAELVFTTRDRADLMVVED